MKPLYQHNCTDCVFLGVYEDRIDLYWCAQGGVIPTIIARYNSDPGDYISGFPFRVHYPELMEAYNLAKAKGLKLL